MFSGAFCILQHIPAICVWLPGVYIHFLPFLPNNVMFIMSFTSCCFKGVKANPCRKLCSGSVAWLCVQGTAHRRVKCAVFAALQTTGRKTLLGTGMDPWRNHCSALALFAMLTSLLVVFSLSLELLMLDCCN